MSDAGQRQILLLGTGSEDTSFTGVTTGTSAPINSKEYDELAITFESVGTTSGGTLLIEEASRPNYSGTWSQVASVSASAFTGGAQQVYHVSPSKYDYLRVRISSTITGGGSVLVFLSQRGT